MEFMGGPSRRVATPGPRMKGQAMTQIATLQTRPADQRGQTEIGWLHSRHSFSFGGYQDPQRMNFRALRVLNDDVVEPGQGFGEHPHRDMEIITWVLDGALKHGDSLGNMQTLAPGELQAMTAGTGIRHSEFNASDTQPVHLLQVWLMPRKQGAKPRYLQREYEAQGRFNQWQTIAADERLNLGGPLPLDTDVVVRVADVQAGQSITLDNPEGRAAYLHVATGATQVHGQPLVAGDALTLETTGTLEFTAQADSQLLWFDLG